MKKILAIILGLVMIATSVAAVKTTKEVDIEEADVIEKNDEPVDFDKKNQEENNFESFSKKTVDKEIKETCKCDNTYEYSIKPFPPKTQEQLDKMIVDPQPTVGAGDLPSQFSWRNFGGDWTTSAKDQENCGSCWAFGALGAMEAAIDISSGYPTTDIDLSEQYVLSCLPASGSCSGGWMSEAVEYIYSTNSGPTGNGINGCTIESCFPYQADDSIPCNDKCDDWDYITDPIQADNKLFEIENYGITSVNPNDPAGWDLLKSWVYTYGPLSVDIYASSGWSSFWSNNNDPNDVYEGTETYVTNHAQVLCGWVDDPDVYNGGYWILKNSWGTDFGYSGFSNVAYGCLQVGDRDVTWVETPLWPYDQDDGGIPDFDMAVFANYEWSPKYPHLGEEIEFTDTSEGNVALREWDFDGDGIVDSNDKRPTWTYNKEGEYNVTLKVTSTFGLDSNRSYTVGAKEIWPPIAVLKPDDYADNELDVQFEGRYSYDVDEGGRIVSYLWDFDDNGATSDLPNPEYTFSEPDKIYDVTLTVTDNDGATDSQTVEVKIDQAVPPVTAIHHKGVGNEGSDWYDRTELIYFTASDWTSVIDTFYRVDGGDWTNYNSGLNKYITIDGEGMHTIEAYSVDFYGNEETPVTEEFGIDKTDPTINVEITGDQEGDMYIPPVEVTIDGSDELSGIDCFLYKLDNPHPDGWIEYTKTIKILEGGSHVLDCMAVDNAGNEVMETYTFELDYAPSSPDIQGPSKISPGEDEDFTFKSYDTDGEDQIEYLIDWGDGTPMEWIGPYESNEEITVSHNWDEKDTYLVRAKARDNHGAESEWATQQVTVSVGVDNWFVQLVQKILDMFPILEEIFPFISKMLNI